MKELKKLGLYLLTLIVCLTACKKIEVAEKLDFGKITFLNASNLKQLPYVVRGTLKYNMAEAISTPFGKSTFRFYKRSGERLLDTLLAVSKTQSYYLYQPDTTKAAVLLTELPPPPPPPPGPLDDATPAPEGYIKIKIKNSSQFLLGEGNIDVEILSTLNSSTVYELVTTVRGITANVPVDFFQFKRPVRNGVGQNSFKFRFLRSDTQAPVLSSNGTVFLSPSPGTSMTVRDFNVFLMDIIYTATASATGITAKDGLLYNLKGSIIAGK